MSVCKSDKIIIKNGLKLRIDLYRRQNIQFKCRIRMIKFHNNHRYGQLYSSLWAIYILQDHLIDFSLLLILLRHYKDNQLQQNQIQTSRIYHTFYKQSNLNKSCSIQQLGVVLLRNLSCRVVAGCSTVTRVYCYIMSAGQKKGMQFFKKFSDMKPNSILSGMKIKGAKQPKSVAQTQTHLNFTQKKQQTPKSVIKDDSVITNKSEDQSLFSKTESKAEPSFKKVDSKIEDTTKAQKRNEESKFNSKIQQKGASIDKFSQSKSNENKSYSPPDQTASEIHKQDIQTTKSPTLKSLPSKPSKEELEHVAVPIKVENVQKKVEISQKKQADKPLTSKKPSSQLSTSIKKQSIVREPQKVKKTDREMVFDQINQFNSKLINQTAIKQGLKYKAKSNQNITEILQNIAKWTSAQGSAAQHEDYEQADRLQTLIEERTNKLDEIQIQFGYLQDQLVQQQQQQVNLLKSQSATMKRLSRKLKLIQIQLQEEASNVKREQMEEIESMKSRQQAERKKIQRIQKDIVSQSQQISEYEKIFKAQLNSKMDPLQQQQQSLQQQKNQYQIQIKKLQQLLKEKKSNLSEVNKKLKSVTQNIGEIKQSFKEQAEKLQQRKNNLQILQNERDEMQITLSDLQTRIIGEIKKMEAKISQKNNEAQELAEMVKNIESKQNNFKDELEARRFALDSFLVSAKLVKQFEEKHKTQKQKLKDLDYKKNTIGGQISKLNDKKDEIKKKLPALQAEQKKYADQKNFKAAGIKKTEIKELTEQLGRIKETMDNYLNQEHALQEQLQYLASSQKETNQKQIQLLRNLAVSQVKYNRVKLQKLREYHTQIGKAIGFAAKEKEKNLRSLQQEISRLEQENKYLNSHYELQKQQEKTVDNNTFQAESQGEQLIDQSAENQIEHTPLVEEEDLSNQNNYDHPSLGQQLQETQQGGYTPLNLD